MPGYYTALTRACSFDGFAERRHLMRAETRHRGSHFQAWYSDGAFYRWPAGPPPGLKGNPLSAAQVKRLLNA